MTTPPLAFLAPMAIIGFFDAAIAEAEAAPPLQPDLTEQYQRALNRAKEATKAARHELRKAPGVTAVGAYTQSGPAARRTASLATMGKRLLAKAEAAPGTDAAQANPFAVALDALTEAGKLLALGAVSAAMPDA